MARKVVVATTLLSCFLFSALAVNCSDTGPQADSAAGSPATPATPTAPEVDDASVTGSIDFRPSVLNLGSEGQYVTLRLELPDGCCASSVYVPSVRLMGTVYAETCFSHENGADGDSNSLMLKFSRDQVRSVLDSGPAQVVFLTGMMTDGTPLYASGLVTVSE